MQFTEPAPTPFLNYSTISLTIQTLIAKSMLQNVRWFLLHICKILYFQTFTPNFFQFPFIRTTCNINQPINMKTCAMFWHVS